jgi:DNA-binding NarL/FixJ family response regulator
VATILIADDRELMRVALRTLFVLRPNWEICGEAEDDREAITKATELQPDVIVLDFKMPLADGLQAASEICKNLPATPVVMYTLYKSAQSESAARLAGVRRVVAKEDGVEGLLLAIETELIAKKYQKKSDQAWTSNSSPKLAHQWRIGKFPSVAALLTEFHNYPVTFFACFLTFAHLFLAALAIPARPAADKTRFFMPTISRSGMSQGICSRTHSIQLALQLG